MKQKMTPCRDVSDGWKWARTWLINGTLWICHGLGPGTVSMWPANGPSQPFGFKTSPSIGFTQSTLRTWSIGWVVMVLKPDHWGVGIPSSYPFIASTRPHITPSIGWLMNHHLAPRHQNEIIHYLSHFYCKMGCIQYPSLVTSSHNHLPSFLHNGWGGVGTNHCWSWDFGW